LDADDDDNNGHFSLRHIFIFGRSSTISRTRRLMHLAIAKLWGNAVAEWLRHYATSGKVAGSRPDVVNFSIYLNLPAVLGPGFHSASNRNEYQK
jgi:hypothetical protein